MIVELMDTVDTYIETPTRETDKPFGEPEFGGSLHRSEGELHWTLRGGITRSTDPR